MCGITGWIDWEQNLENQGPTLTAMVKTLTNRGPDAEGIWLSPRAGLAHRRLIVVDPAGGAQPMVRKKGDHTLVLTYNGELYNTEEIRRALVSRGYRFQGHSDTEVLLCSYMAWGESCVEKLNGIYAFAVWDAAAERLFMARDRMGVKPLFYTQVGSTFLYASELKALLTHPAVQPEIDREGLAEIFALGPSRTQGHGVFRNVQELRPGHYLTLDRKGLRITRYWALESMPHQDDLITTKAKVKELVADTIKRQLVSDVPICTFLSGGLDSSIITAYAAKHCVENGLGQLHTFSIDYVDNDRYFRASRFQPNSDSQWVGKASEALQTIHHPIIIDTPQLVEALTTATIARDLPGMADVDSSLYLFCREVKKQATVALSGECADEVFGGYPWYHDENALNSGTFPWINSVQTRVDLLSPEASRLIQPADYINQRYQETIAEVPRLAGEEPLEARRREMFYLNLNWFMANLLDRKDRMSMATGLEVRVPFCDHRLVEYVWNIPWAMKMYQNREKGILRSAMEGVLPDDILWRRKSPYPKTHHPAYLAAVRSLILQILDDPGSPILPLINQAKVRQMALAEGDSFNRPWYGQLMTGPQLFAYLMQINTWLAKYKVVIR